MNKMYVYLDLNVFNDLERKDQQAEPVRKMYTQLEPFLLQDSVIIPYSNAHLDDLIRGYKKDSSYIDGHLTNIEKFTRNLCLCQYWKQAYPIWHIRPIKEFFRAAVKNKELNFETWDDMLNYDFSTEDLHVPNVFAIQNRLWKLMPVPKEFKKIYSEDPIFGTIYPLTRVEMNMAALGADLYNFSVNIQKDFSLYKSLRRFLLQSIQKYRINNQLVQSVNKLNPGIPDYLNLDQLFDQLRLGNKTGIISVFDRFFETFFRFDLLGYKSDAKFPNMIDDSLHTYYAAHCDVFISKDERCRAKAIKTYERLNVTTEVCTPELFYEKYAT